MQHAGNRSPGTRAAASRPPEARLATGRKKLSLMRNHRHRNCVNQRNQAVSQGYRENRQAFMLMERNKEQAMHTTTLSAVAMESPAELHAPLFGSCWIALFSALAGGARCKTVWHEMRRHQPDRHPAGNGTDPAAAAGTNSGLNGSGASVLTLRENLEQHGAQARPYTSSKRSISSSPK